jgi:hypothetical protein
MAVPAKGLIEYLFMFGGVLALAVYELVSVIRSQRRDRRILNGSNARTQGERKRSSDKLS